MDMNNTSRDLATTAGFVEDSNMIIATSIGQGDILYPLNTQGANSTTTQNNLLHVNLTELPPFGAAELFSIIIFTIFLVLALLGNVVVLVTVYHRRKLHRPSYFLLANLATGDLLSTLFVMPLYDTTCFARRWLFESWVCQYLAFAVQMLAFQSLTTLSCVSVDRYLAICQPLDYHMRMTSRRVCVLIVYSWLHAVLLNIPPLCGWGHFHLDLYLYGCHTVWAPDINNRTYINFLGLSFFPLTIVITTCYVLIYRTSRQVYSSASHPNNDSSSMKDELRAALMFFVVICSFLVSWCPFVAVRMYKIYTGPTVAQREAERVTLFLFQLGSLFNPYIYGILSREFKQEMKNFLGKRCNSIGV